MVIFTFGDVSFQSELVLIAEYFFVEDIVHAPFIDPDFWTLFCLTL